jgi:toxin ParE1/3/4
VEREVVYLETAQADIRAIYDYVASMAGQVTAMNYIGRIYDVCDALSFVPERGNRHDDVLPGLRAIGFEGRATILFRVESERVEIVKVAYGGRDWKRSPGDERP